MFLVNFTFNSVTLNEMNVEVVTTGYNQHSFTSDTTTVSTIDQLAAEWLSG